MMELWALEERIDQGAGLELERVDYEDVGRLYEGEDMAGHTNTWKHAERRIADILGGRRLGPGADRADVRARWLSVEVKHRQPLPAWLKGALRQAEAYAGPAQLPIAVLHEAGTLYRAAVVCMTLAQFEAWFGALELPADLEPADVQDGLESGRTIAEIGDAGRRNPA